ncbi:transcriptional regulator BolA [Vibrio sp. 10N.286.49.C2]|uniref:transcriptional regulator BolA n=1 Tax=unclassified Vibrio TaxID=2614977 RepID=UPI000C830D5F|nr:MULTISPECIES: transcriptional regulator BolA [unclassified Vibrio]PMH38895.1 transcriptional regulator BolA [Vibrio sp. 10N.286.49.C2]PMH55370.1 transcriptional regulator BolA [Vibrio sp. 10N.286.49.B1]PMH78878.1 transcriptional regulator BolA [Vibrio sp. 10N.286.48.B7]
MIQQTIEQKLHLAFEPTFLDVLNESYMHNVPPGSESHFKVVVVSNAFSGDRLIARHRKINTVLADELSGVIHALAIHTYTPQEWAEKNQQSPISPDCAGGGH